MKLLVSGASGLVGSELVPGLRAAGHEVVRLVRGGNAGEPNAVGWDPVAGHIDATTKLQGLDGIIHLAGENIGEGRWSREKKRLILESRVSSTKLLTEIAARLSPRPKVFLCASAIGIYGNRGDETLTEASTLGNDFLADVCKDWEAAAAAAREADIRVVHLRFGAVLSPKGGALAKMLTPFKAGMGGPVGDGEQYLSWVSLPDAAGAILHVLQHAELSGPVNVVAPDAVKNRDFAHALGDAINRPAKVPIPAIALKFAFGEMAEATVLASQRVQPQKLVGNGYSFRHPDIVTAFRELLAER